VREKFDPLRILGLQPFEAKCREKCSGLREMEDGRNYVTGSFIHQNERIKELDMDQT
jgi:hypothetical protein